MPSVRRVLSVDPAQPTHRLDGLVGLQEAFLDYHIRNVDDRYDFDSIRVGIQPFTADFRGLLFIDQPLGIRFFGTRDNNRWQYNLGWFRRLEKDTNSGLNDIGKPLRNDNIYLFNLYKQDFFVPGFTLQGTLTGFATLLNHSEATHMRERVSPRGVQAERGEDDAVNGLLLVARQELEGEAVTLQQDAHRASAGKLAEQHFLGQRLLDLFLDDAGQRSCTHTMSLRCLSQAMKIAGIASSMGETPYTKTTSYWRLRNNQAPAVRPVATKDR